MTERILKLMREPSSYAGLAGLLAGLGLFGFSQEMWMQIGGAIAAVAGVVAMVVLDPADQPK